MSLPEVNTKKLTALENKHEYKIRMVKHVYPVDVAQLNQVGLDNFNLRNTRNKLATANSQWNGTNYWTTNVKPIKGPEGPRNYAPVQLHPVMKPGIETPWAPFKFSMPPDNYRTTLGKYIQY